MKSTLQGAGVFFATMFVGLTLFDAFGIYVLGQFEEKFGGPWDNFVLGLQLSVPICLVCALGYLLGSLALRRWRRPKSRPLVPGIVTAAAALVLSASGLVGRMAVQLPLGSVSSLVFMFASLGLLLGLISERLPGGRENGESPPNHSLHRTRPFGPRR